MLYSKKIARKKLLLFSDCRPRIEYVKPYQKCMKDVEICKTSLRTYERCRSISRLTAMHADSCTYAMTLCLVDVQYRLSDGVEDFVFVCTVTVMHACACAGTHAFAQCLWTCRSKVLKSKISSCFALAHSCTHARVRTHLCWVCGLTGRKCWNRRIRLVLRDISLESSRGG